jgi:hypothetical protein
VSCPNCKDTGWVELPGISGLDDAATTFEECDCAAGLRQIVDHSTRRWAKMVIGDASDKGDYGEDELNEINAIRAKAALVSLDREEALSYGEGGG